MFLEDTAEALLPLEEKRLNLLAGPSCQDLPKCSEQEELFNGTMLSIYKKTNAKLDEIFAPYQQGLLNK